MKRYIQFLVVCCAVILAGTRESEAQSSIQLIQPDAPTGGWNFHDGREFPGAKGSLALEKEGSPSRGPALALQGDFSGGGNYVSMGRSVEPIDPRMISFNLRYPGASSLSMRLEDANGTTHQLVLEIEKRDAWQRIQFPAEAFFKNIGTPNAVRGVQKYEKWGGTRGNFAPPLKAITVILRRNHVQEGHTSGSLRVADFEISGVSAEEKSAAKGDTVQQTVRLDDLLRFGFNDWKFYKSHNGTKAGVDVVKDQPEAGQYALKFHADFSQEGHYAGFVKSLDTLQIDSVEAIHLRMMSPNMRMYTVQIQDASGQTHQRKWIPIEGDGQWRDVTIRPDAIVGVEKWGGANDGKLHQPVKGLTILVNPDTKNDVLAPELWLTDIRADVTQAGASDAPAFTEDFEKTDVLSDWETRGDAKRQTGDAMQGEAALRLTRPLTQVNEPNTATGPAFPAAPGTWTVSGAARAEIHSPDSSYHGALHVAWLDGNDKVLERKTIQETYNQPTWRAFREQVTAPSGAVAGRLELSMHKTYGWYEVDDLAAVRVATAPLETKVDRVIINADAIGTLFLPEQPVVLNTLVRTRKPLEDAERRATYAITDYWGAEYVTGELMLEFERFRDGHFTYRAAIDASAADLPLNKYFGVTMTVDPDSEAFLGFRSFARLPEAPSHQYAHDKIPFSLRNWDPRVAGYVDIAARMGFRKVNSWGDLNLNQLEKSNIHRAEDFRKYGMNVEVGHRGVSMVENGRIEVMDKLHEGSVALVKNVGDLAAYYCLGNEPHGDLEQIRHNVQAYKIVYEAIKATDPDAFVVSTSHGPDETYFEEGYHQYCDAYDFHIYESYRGMPSRIQKFNELGEKYGAVKPVFCTEMGVNSQGMTRHFVGVEMIKKFTTFFAYGGAHVSWFTIMYPDPQGTIFGSSAEAHNMFDARYRTYSPKLDAIVHYHYLNSYLDKTLVDKTRVDNGTEQYLFANDQGECLQVIWNDENSESVWVPLPKGADVRMIRIDGHDAKLRASDGGIGVLAGNEPILLLYDQAKPALTPVEAGRMRLVSVVRPLVRGEEMILDVEGTDLTPDRVRVEPPPRWTVNVESLTEQAVRVRVTAPRDTSAREGRILIQRLGADGVLEGELPVAIPLTGRIATRLLPSVQAEDDTPMVQLEIRNHGDEELALTWALGIDEQFPITDGSYKLSQPQPPTAFFGEAAAGEVQIAPGDKEVVRVPVSSADAATVYRVSSMVTDRTGASLKIERYMGGFAGIHRAEGTIKIDGKLDDQAWANATVIDVNRPEQRYVLPRLIKETAPWAGPDDLSGRLRMLWDDENLYVAMEVKDDVFAGGKASSSLWNQDGLQFMFDPSRISDQKPGAYDYSMGMGKDGTKVWRNWSASPAVMAGLAEDVKLAIHRDDDSTGNMTYEIAFPWASLAPFEPDVGGNLGMAVIINEDDGAGRFGFMSWFGGVHSKELDLLGDLILLGE